MKTSTTIGWRIWVVFAIAVIVWTAAWYDRQHDGAIEALTERVTALEAAHAPAEAE